MKQNHTLVILAALLVATPVFATDSDLMASRAATLNMQRENAARTKAPAPAKAGNKQNLGEWQLQEIRNATPVPDGHEIRFYQKMRSGPNRTNPTRRWINDIKPIDGFAPGSIFFVIVPKDTPPFTNK